MKCFVIGGWTHYFQRRTSFNSINRRAMVLVCNVNCTGWCHSHTPPQGLSISLLKSSFSLDTPLIHSLLYHLKWQSCVAYYSGHFLRNKLLRRFTIVLTPPSVFIQTKIATMSWGSILHGDNIDQMPPDIISLYEVRLLDCLLIVSLSNQKENGFSPHFSVSRA